MTDCFRINWSRFHFSFFTLPVKSPNFTVFELGSFRAWVTNDGVEGLPGLDVVPLKDDPEFVQKLPSLSIPALAPQCTPSCQSPELFCVHVWGICFLDVRTQGGLLFVMVERELGLDPPRWLHHCALGFLPARKQGQLSASTSDNYYESIFVKFSHPLPM